MSYDLIGQQALNISMSDSNTAVSAYALTTVLLSPIDILLTVYWHFMEQLNCPVRSPVDT